MSDQFNHTDQKKIAEKLKPVLAESVQLYIATQNVHWNVTGPMFQAIHALTEEQYLELAPAIDEIAERIRALGQKAPGTMAQYIALGSITDSDENATAEAMVRALLQGHNQLVGRIRPLVAESAEVNDEVTAGLLTDRLTVHEKAQWMLGAMLGE